MNLIEHLADHLDYEGFGKLATLEEDGNIFWGELPETRNAAGVDICVMSTDSAYGGKPGGARIQIHVRGPEGDERTPYEMACAITDCLQGFEGYLHGDGPYAIVTEVLSSAQGAGTDQNGRRYYVSNYRIAYCDFSKGG